MLVDELLDGHLGTYWLVVAAGNLRGRHTAEHPVDKELLVAGEGGAAEEVADEEEPECTEKIVGRENEDGDAGRHYQVRHHLADRRGKLRRRENIPLPSPEQTP